MTTIINRRDERTEEELKAMEAELQSLVEQENTNSAPPPKEPVEDESTLSKEESTYKKRYADLRRHSQKQIDTLKTEIQEMKEALAKAPSSSGIPTTVEEVEEWAKKNPQAASIIRRLASEEADRRSEALKERVEKSESTNQELLREREIKKILKVHPDFEDIQESDEFHDWVETKPKRVQDTVYDGSAEDVIWALNYYKREKNISNKAAERDAARPAISRKVTATPTDDKKPVYTESMVEKMSLREYAEHEKAIIEAQRNGTFIHDISGAAS